MSNFKRTKEILEKLDDIYTRLYNGEDISGEEYAWLDSEFAFEFACALNKEIPNIEKIAKMICVMDDSLGIKIEVK